MISFLLLKSSLRTKKYRSKPEVSLAKKSRKQEVNGERMRGPGRGRDREHKAVSIYRRRRST